MINVVSFSLWGNKLEYMDGAVLALESAVKYYPGWEYRFYVREDVASDVVTKLESRGAKIVRDVYTQAYSGMALRFLPAGDPSVDVFLCRDADSLITKREQTAVFEWLNSRANFHIMRDHPTHILPIMGGLWGCRGGILRDIAELTVRYNSFHKYGSDQKFLAKKIYPRICKNAFIHSSFTRLFGESTCFFPTPRLGLEFVGRANRSGFDQEQDAILKGHIGNNSNLRTLPNIYSPLGRIWLLFNKFF